MCLLTPLQTCNQNFSARRRHVFQLKKIYIRLLNRRKEIINTRALREGVIPVGRVFSCHTNQCSLYRFMCIFVTHYSESRVNWRRCVKRWADRCTFNNVFIRNQAFQIYKKQLIIKKTLNVNQKSDWGRLSATYTKPFKNLI